MMRTAPTTIYVWMSYQRSRALHREHKRSTSVTRSFGVEVYASVPTPWVSGFETRHSSWEACWKGVTV